jgi:hypothetical protein
MGVQLGDVVVVVVDVVVKKISGRRSVKKSEERQGRSGRARDKARVVEMGKKVSAQTATAAFKCEILGLSTRSQ